MYSGLVFVMYVESIKKSVRCCEQSVNFSQNFSVKDAPDNPVIITAENGFNLRFFAYRNFFANRKLLLAERFKIGTGNGLSVGFDIIGRRENARLSF